MAYTQRFDEYTKILTENGYTAVSSEQNTTFVNIKNYRKVAILIKCLTVATSLDADVEVSTDGVTGGLFTLKSITQVGGSGDSDIILINVRDEELSKPVGASATEYEWLRVETTPSGSCTYVVIVFGLEPRFAPVGTTEYDQVIA